MTEDTNPATLPDAAHQSAVDDQDRTAGPIDDAPVGVTQAQFNAIIANVKKKARLSTLKEIGDVDVLKAKAAKLDELEAANLSEIEKLQRKLEEKEAAIQQKEQEAKQATLATLRLRVGQELGLPPVLAERLQGDDVDTLKADAQALVDAIKADGGEVRHIPNLDATAGARQQGPRVTKITPGEQAAARAVGQSDEEYLAAKALLEAAKGAVK